MRKLALTDPPTLKPSQVALVFDGQVKKRQLVNLDEQGHFRPSFYLRSASSGSAQQDRLVSWEKRDTHISAFGRSKGDPQRRYSYEDLLWLGLFLYLKEETGPLPSKNIRIGAIIRNLRKEHKGRCPSTTRFLIRGSDIYSIDDENRATCLTRGGQMTLIELLTTENVVGDVSGRVQLLQARKEIHRAFERMPPPEDEEREAS